MFSNRISDSQLGFKRSYILLHHLLRQLLSLRISCFHPLVRSRGCPRGDLLKWAGVTLATKWTYWRQDLARAKRSRPTRGPALLYGRSIDGRTHTHTWTFPLYLTVPPSLIIPTLIPAFSPLPSLNLHPISSALGGWSHKERPERLGLYSLERRRQKGDLLYRFIKPGGTWMVTVLSSGHGSVKLEGISLRWREGFKRNPRGNIFT